MTLFWWDLMVEWMTALWCPPSVWYGIAESAS